MKKNILSFWIAIIALIGVSTIPTQAHAYLIPLIGGLGWLISVIVAGVIACSAFVWIHVIKFKQWTKKGKKGEASIKEDNDDVRKT